MWRWFSQMLPVLLAGALLAACSPGAAGEQAGPCAAVQHPAPDSAEGQAIIAGLVKTQPSLAGYAPPPDWVRGIDQLNDWAIVETNGTDQFEPGVFVVHKQGAEYRFVSVWGGVATQPNEIQNWLREQAPAAPATLFDCFRPRGAPFSG